MTDSMAISHSDTVLPVAPMFHANAWGLPYTCVMTGARLVLPGPNVDAESILDLMVQERVTFAGGVPTVWLGVLQALEANPNRWKFSQSIRIICGGSAPPEQLIRGLDKFGLSLLHLWGMTETTPLATIGLLKQHMLDWHEDKQYAVRCKQGCAGPFVELRVMRRDDFAPGEPMPEGIESPWDPMGRSLPSTNGSLGALPPNYSPT
jgi:fatty-acyl-CoA synthase